MQKKPPGTAEAAPGAGRRTFNVLALASISVFSIVAALAVLVFFYQAHLVRAISDMDTELIKVRKSFEPEFIEEASRLNARIEATRELVNNHRAFSPLFGILEKKTLESVRFQDFSFNASDGKEATLAMTGQAKSFNAVALQSDVFGSDRAFKDPVFSNFALNEHGDIVFNFKTSLDPALLRYSETVLGSAAGDESADESGEDAAAADFEEEAVE